MDNVKKLIRAIITEEFMNQKWLSSDVVVMLIDRFALRSPTLGELRWEYSDSLPGNRWGEYDVKTMTLKVSKIKTRNQFEQQVRTVLHEIRHWNQHASFVEQVINVHPEKTPEEASLMFMYKYTKFAKMSGTNPFEDDAREFADQTFSKAMSAVNKSLYNKMIRGMVMS